MAFFVTMPISIRMPIRTGMESAFCVAISATARDAEITISDRGPGVDATQIPAIFQAFVRNAGGSGTGLGLAIAANALRLHGGTIRAENREGGGLTILSQIPLRPRE